MNFDSREFILIFPLLKLKTALTHEAGLGTGTARILTQGNLSFIYFYKYTKPIPVPAQIL
jgi:hypothetical protein